MVHDLNQHPVSPTGTDTKRNLAKPILSAEDLEDMRAVVTGQKEHGGTPWAEVKTTLNL